MDLRERVAVRYGYRVEEGGGQGGIVRFPTWSHLVAIYLGENSGKTKYSIFMDASHTQTK